MNLKKHRANYGVITFPRPAARQLRADWSVVESPSAASAIIPFPRSGSDIPPHDHPPARPERRLLAA